MQNLTKKKTRKMSKIAMKSKTIIISKLLFQKINPNKKR